MLMAPQYQHRILTLIQEQFHNQMVT